MSILSYLKCIVIKRSYESRKYLCMAYDHHITTSTCDNNKQDLREPYA